MSLQSLSRPLLIQIPLTNFFLTAFAFLTFASSSLLSAQITKLTMPKEPENLAAEAFPVNFFQNVTDRSTTGDRKAMEALATALINSRDKQGYDSITAEWRLFSGSYTAPALPEGKTGVWGMAVFSDDGCTILQGKTTNNTMPTGPSILHNAGKGQTLEKLNQSVHVLPITLKPGESVDLTVKYSNTHYYKNAADSADIDGATIFVFLLPHVELVELAPKVIGEDGKEIADSETPVAFPKSNEMVEVINLNEQVEQNRIAHREMKVKIHGGKSFDGKKAIWTMKAWGAKENTAVRGDWKHSKVDTHKNCFEKSATYSTYDYIPIGQTSSQTIIKAEGEDGYTSIRANLPPLGWNHADIKVKIEGVDTEITIARFVVPFVVVIDAGHGGNAGQDIGDNDEDENGLKRGRSDVNHSIGGWWSVQKTINGKKVWIDEKVYPGATGILEKDLTLEYARELRNQLSLEHTDTSLPLRRYLTRDSNINLGGYERARLARDKGADICLALHFNASSINKTARGSLVCTRTKKNNNYNYKEDLKLESTITGPVNAALKSIDNAERKNIHPVELGTAVTSDILGFYQDTKYHPIRSTLLEVEFIHSEGGDQLINGTKKDKAKQDSMKALAKSLIESQKVFVVQED